MFSVVLWWKYDCLNEAEGQWGELWATIIIILNMNNSIESIECPWEARDRAHFSLFHGKPSPLLHSFPHNLAFRIWMCGVPVNEFLASKQHKIADSRQAITASLFVVSQSAIQHQRYYLFIFIGWNRLKTIACLLMRLLSGRDFAATDWSRSALLLLRDVRLFRTI